MFKVFVQPRDRDRGRIAADPSHTTGHAGPHPAVEHEF